MPALSMALFSRAWGLNFGAALRHEIAHNSMEPLGWPSFFLCCRYVSAIYAMFGCMAHAFSKHFEWEQPVLLDRGYETQEHLDSQAWESTAYRVFLAVLTMGLVGVMIWLHFKGKRALAQGDQSKR